MQNGRSTAVLGLIIGLALVLSTYLVTDTLRDIRMSQQIIKVRGYSEVAVRSDLVKWSISVSASDSVRAEAYKKLVSHRDKVLSFVKERNFANADIELGTVYVKEINKRNEEGKSTNEIESYAVSQSIRVKSSDVDNVADASTKIQDLLGQGVELHAYSPMYYYSRVDELKQSLLVNATKDARLRATTLAEGSGVKLGALKAARQGVFSIRSADTSGISEDSSDDTSSIEKKVAAIVTVDYAMK